MSYSLSLFFFFFFFHSIVKDKLSENPRGYTQFSVNFIGPYFPMGPWKDLKISPQRYLLPKSWNLWVLHIRARTDCADVTKLRSCDGESTMDYPECPKHNQAHDYKRKAEGDFTVNRRRRCNQSGRDCGYAATSQGIPPEARRDKDGILPRASRGN